MAIDRFISDKRSRKAAFRKRTSGLLKKSQELATLCDLDVCFFSSGLEGDGVIHWPQDRLELQRVIARFCASSNGNGGPINHKKMRKKGNNDNPVSVSVGIGKKVEALRELEAKIGEVIMRIDQKKKGRAFLDQACPRFDLDGSQSFFSKNQALQWAPMVQDQPPLICVSGSNQTNDDGFLSRLPALIEFDDDDELMMDGTSVSASALKEKDGSFQYAEPYPDLDLDGGNSSGSGQVGFCNDCCCYSTLLLHGFINGGDGLDGSCNFGNGNLMRDLQSQMQEQTIPGSNTIDFLF